MQNLNTTHKAMREIAEALAQVAPRLKTNPRAHAFAVRAFGYQDVAGVGLGIAPTLGATTISNDADLEAARVGFAAAFLERALVAGPDPIEDVALTIPSSHRSLSQHALVDVPGFEEWLADRKMSGLKALTLPLLTARKWSSGLRLKNDDIKYDNLGLTPAAVDDLGMKARTHRSDMMVETLLNGFDGAAYPDTGNGLSYDGAFFFSDAHDTGDNKLTVALDASGLDAAEQLLAAQITYDGRPLNARGTHIIVGPKLEKTALKLLKQEYANGESNINKDRYQLIVSPRIRGTYDDYWFVADLSKPYKPLRFLLTEEISTSAIVGRGSVPGFVNDESWFGAQAQYAVGYLDHRLIVGSAVA